MGSMLTMTHSTSQTRSPQDSPSLPDQVRRTPHSTGVQTPVHVSVMNNCSSRLRVFRICYLQDLLGITNGADALSLDGDCEDDDITEPIAPCTSLTPTQVRVVMVRHSAEVCISVFKNSIHLAS